MKGISCQGSCRENGYCAVNVSHLYFGDWKLLPLQGARQDALIPRVLPWARSFCPFRAYGGKVARIHNKNPRQEDNLQEDLLWSGPGNCDDSLLHQYRLYIQCRLMANLIHYEIFAFYSPSNCLDIVRMLKAPLLS